MPAGGWPRLGSLVPGALLNLAVTFGPALALRRATGAGLGVAAVGVTALFLADAWRDDTVLPRTDSAADGAARRWAAVTGIVMLLALWIGSATGDSRPFPPQQALGGLLMLAGAALRHLAVRALGPDFVTEVTPRPGHRLVSSGVYAYLRHPSEVGLALAMVGAALALGSLAVALITGLVLVPLSILRVRHEETELRRAQTSSTTVPKPSFEPT